MKWFGAVSIVLILVAPWLVAEYPALDFWLSGAGIMEICTYIGVLPFFQKNFGYTLLGVLLMCLLSIFAIIYTIAVFMLLKV
ncbi:hypothetical protein ACVQ8P_05475 [Dellaglioa sp. BT-FLS60]